MAKSKKLSRKELNQPDQFVTRGEHILQNLVENRKRYAIYAGSLIALVIVVNLIVAYIHSQNDKASIAYSNAVKVYDADIAKDGEQANPSATKPTFATEEAKYLAAIKKFNALIEKYSGSNYATVAQFYLGNSFFYLERYSKAREAYQKFLDEAGSELDSFKFIAYHNIGQCYDGEGQPEKAIEAYQKVLALDGEAGKDEAGYRIAMIYKRLGKKDEAIKILLETQEKYPDSPVKTKIEKLLTFLRGPAPKPAVENKKDDAVKKTEKG